METVHPVADEWTDEYAVHVCSSRSVLLTDSIDAFLVTSAEADRRPVLLTRPDARLSALLTLALGRAGAFWAVRGADGVYDGLTGHRVDGFADLWSPVRVEQPRLPGFGVPREDTEAILMFEVYAHHRVSDNLGLGRLPELVVSGLGGAPLDLWGRVEPLTDRWHEGALTEAIRRSMPDSDVLQARSADGSFAVISAGRTSRGLMQLVKGGVPAGRYAPPRAELVDRAAAMLVSAHTAFTPTIGLVSVAEYDAGVTQTAAARRPEAPVAVLLGPSVLHDVEADLPRLRERHDVTALGRERVPSMLVRFGAPDQGMWEQLLHLAGDLGPEKLRRAMLLEGR